MAKYEMETVDEKGKKGVVLKDIAKMENAIHSVCSKIEQAEGGYLKVAEQVYLLNKHKVHKNAGYTNFKDYIRDRTGMGATTAHTLINYWKLHIEAEGHDNIIIWLETRTMREVVKLTSQLKDTVSAIQEAIEVYKGSSDEHDIVGYIEAALITKNEMRKLEDKSNAETDSEDAGYVDTDSIKDALNAKMGENAVKQFDYCSNFLSNFGSLDKLIEWIEDEINSTVDGVNHGFDNTEIRVELQFYNK